MSDALSITEIDGQHVELLPARTVMSLFSTDGGGTNIGGPSGEASGGIGAQAFSGAGSFTGDATNVNASGISGPGGSAVGG